MIWMEGINDFSKNGNRDADVVKAEMKAIIERIRTQKPNLKIIGATVTSALGSTSAAHGFAEQDAKRQALNDFIRNSGLFDAVIDFDKAILDPQTGGMRAEFVPDNTVGGAGDKLHPNRLGYLAMGLAIDLDVLMK
jgi:lysophospholipase L1-like esterase